MSRQRAEELLASDATQGLGRDERAELDRLLTDHRDLGDGGYERAAAALHLALLGPEEPLPETTRQRLRRAAAGFAAGETPAPAAREPAAARPAVAWGPWLAAAAALILALAGWWPRLSPEPAPPQVVETPLLGPEQAPVKNADALDLPWTATEDPAAAGAAGGVVWSSAEQRGLMRISGLEANDPAVSQYQLWIFDKGRDDRYPVDGGVFDMPSGGGEAVVAIDAKIRVDEPVLFAITVERPGGVVVSDRERIVLVAQPQAA